MSLTIGSLFSGSGMRVCGRIPLHCGRIVSEAGRRANVPRPLTRSLDYTEEGLAMNATRRAHA